MNGTGFYIWNLPAVMPASRTITALRRANATWVSIKVADGTLKHNQVGADGRTTGNDRYLLEFIDELRQAGITVGGWHFVYPIPTLSPGAQAGVAGERYQKLSLDHLLIDGEQVTSIGAFWKTLADGRPNPDRNRSANTYMNQLRAAGIPLSAPAALSSYRFPTVHGLFPFPQFLNHEASKFSAPQMYWIGSHNPREQLERCLAEYAAISPGLPMVPMGAAFGAGSWEPTEADLVEFVDAARDAGCPAWGFWSLDWVLAHNKTAWLDAIAGGSTPPPPPPPPPPTIPARVRITGLEDGETLRMRETIFGTICAQTWNGAEFDVMGNGLDADGRAWYQVGESIWIASWYTEPT